MTIASSKTLIEPFLQIIRNFRSPDPALLPLRGKWRLRDDSYQIRLINQNLYAQSKDMFVQDCLALTKTSEYPGLYFFFDNQNLTYPFFYIGKAENLYARITKHFLDFDYFFYASAFPCNYERYRSECLSFYGEGKYKKNRSLYEKQFDAFKLSPFKEIAWISIPQLKDPELLGMVEAHSIRTFKPLANGTKGHSRSNELSQVLFATIKSIVESEFLH